MILKELDINKRLNENIPDNRDPDRYSGELKEYHKCLWSNRKLNGKPFTLSDGDENGLIYSNGELEIVFTPDSITNSFKDSHRKTKINGKTESELIAEFRKEDSEIDALLNKYENEEDYKIGTSIIFPIAINGNSIRWTLNIARGILYKIHDRIDLTLECIRRHYQEPNTYNPLRSSIDRNLEFFNLFDSFESYVDFFFLKCFFDENGNIKGLSGTLDFNDPFPSTKEQYRTYVKNMLEFMDKRKEDIGEWIKNGN